MIWTLRYKRPQGVAAVQIETLSDQLDDEPGRPGTGARAFGQRFVNAQATPATRFISMEPWLVASEVAPMREARIDRNQAQAAEPRDQPKTKTERIGA